MWISRVFLWPEYVPCHLGSTLSVTYEINATVYQRNEIKSGRLNEMQPGIGMVWELRGVATIFGPNVAAGILCSHNPR